MSFGIFRFEKRHWSALKNLEREANRTPEDHYERDVEFENSNIDWTRTHLNKHLKKTTGWRDQIDLLCMERDVKTRGDSVCLIDGLYSASPEWMESHSKKEIEDYFEDCKKFHIKHFCNGDEELLLNFVIHYDESNIGDAHAAAASVPLIFGGKKTKRWRMNAKELCGDRQHYRDLQEAFYQEVARKYSHEHHVSKMESHRRHIKANRHIADCLQKDLAELRELYREFGDNAERTMLTVLQELTDRGLKSRIVREWKLLQDNFPDIADKVHLMNIRLKNEGLDDFLPSSNEGGVRTIVRNEKSKTNETSR